MGSKGIGDSLFSITKRYASLIFTDFASFFDDFILTGSLWVCSCLARSEEFENFLVQLNSWAYLQLKGFSPLCDLMWILRFSDRAKARLHPSCCKKERNKLSWKIHIILITHLNCKHMGSKCNFFLTAFALVAQFQTTCVS